MLHNFLQACVHKTHACGGTIFDQRTCERYDQVDWSPCPNGIDFDFIQPDKHEIQLGGRQQNLSLCQVSGTQCQFFSLQKSSNLSKRICDVCHKTAWLSSTGSSNPVHDLCGTLTFKENNVVLLCFCRQWKSMPVKWQCGTRWEQWPRNYTTILWPGWPLNRFVAHRSRLIMAIAHQWLVTAFSAYQLHFTVAVSSPCLAHWLLIIVV